MNAAFQLICGENSTKLKLTPATDGGEDLKIAEVVDYLNNIRCNFELPTLSAAVSTLTEETVLEINNNKMLPVREAMLMELRDENMTCVARFMPPSDTGELMDMNEILNDLNYKGVKFGIDEDAINGFLRNREYFKEYVFAKGKEPVQGSDAYIDYHFNTDLKARPTLKEDGSVDFFNLNIINHVEEGECLATLHREQPGISGCDVLGGRIKPRDVRRMVLKFGRNIDISEDMNEIFATCSGHVNLFDGRVFVSNVMEVEDVNTSTGNIEYDGNVQVNGNVATNFSIKAKGNVEVRGVVEGAEIEAGGNITIARGMNGMSRGRLKAGGNIIAQFIENSFVDAGGYVESGSIMHSEVLAGTEIHVNGKRGFISGGKVSATTLVEAKILGSDMGTETLVEIGISPAVKRRHKELEGLIAANDKTINRAIPIMEAAKEKIVAGREMSEEQVDNLKGLVQLVKEKKKEQRSLKEELETLTELLSDEKQAAVVVQDAVYPGVKIAISDVSKIIKEPVRYCRFIKDRGDVRMVGMI
ncbi:MAG: FapA family protein [Lachnospiraceae bacterium]|nr:FapA family protein [Lachnospiraceae bacterium]